MVDKHVRLYSLFQNYTSFIWVTPPPLLLPLPQSFCNVIDSILRKCIYFQIKYLFKEMFSLSEIILFTVMKTHGLDQSIIL